MNKDFILEKVISNEDNSIVMLGKDGTCIKKVDLPKCYSRLKNEAECLKILGGEIAPKLISYDDRTHELRMEYIEGLTLIEFICKYNEIPKWFFAKLTAYLCKMIDAGVEYGGDMKLGEHIIVQPEKNDIRIIDFGISNIATSSKSIEIWKEHYMKTYAFVFEKTKDDQTSKIRVKRSLLNLDIPIEIIDKYFENYDVLEK